MASRLRRAIDEEPIRAAMGQEGEEAIRQLEAALSAPRSKLDPGLLEEASQVLAAKRRGAAEALLRTATLDADAFTGGSRYNISRAQPQMKVSSGNCNGSLDSTNLDSYWQSCGSQPHWIEMASPQPGTPLGEVGIFVKHHGNFSPKHVVLKAYTTSVVQESITSSDLPERVIVSNRGGRGGRVPDVGGVYVQAGGRTRNGAPYYDRIDRAEGGAIYFDGRYWKLIRQGSGADVIGWNFSQQGTAQALPLGPWMQALARVPEVAVDYSGVRLDVPETAAGSWKVLKTIPELARSPARWETLLTATEAGMAERIRIEIHSNHQDGHESRVTAVRASCAAGPATLAALETAIEKSRTAGVEARLVEQATAKLGLLKVAVAEAPIIAAMATADAAIRNSFGQLQASSQQDDLRLVAGRPTVGDRVKVVRPVHDCLGLVGVIRRDDSDRAPYRIDFDHATNVGWFDESSVSLYTEVPAGPVHNDTVTELAAAVEAADPIVRSSLLAEATKKLQALRKANAMAPLIAALAAANAFLKAGNGEGLSAIKIPQPHITVSSASNRASMLDPEKLSMHWTSNGSIPSRGRPHWIDMASAQPGTPLGELSMYVKNHGSYSPRHLIIKRFITSSSTWAVLKDIPELAREPARWVTLLTAAEAGPAERVRIEIHSNHDDGCDSKVTAVRASGAAGPVTLAALEAAIEAAEAAEVDTKLIAKARHPLTSLRQKVAIAEMKNSADHGDIDGLAVAIGRATSADVDLKLITSMMETLTKLREAKAEHDRIMRALNHASDVESLIAAFAEVSAASPGTFSRPAELDSFRLMLGDMLSAAIDNAGTQAAALRAAVDTAMAAAPLVDGKSQSLTASLRTAQFQVERAESEERRRAERVAAGAPAELPPMPNEFLCPITLEVMADPVTAADGYTYERTAIEQWLASGRGKSPITNQDLEHRRVMGSMTIKKMIAEWPEIEHQRILSNYKDLRRVQEEARGSTKRKRVEFEREGEPTDAAKQIGDWLVSKCGICRADASCIAPELIESGAKNISHIKELVETKVWQDLALFKQVFASIDIICRQRIENAVADAAKFGDATVKVDPRADEESLHVLWDVLPGLADLGSNNEPI